MAVIFHDGFDWYQGGAANATLTGDMGKRWSGMTGTGAVCLIGPSYARAPSGQGLRVSASNTGMIYKAFGANYTQGLLGFAWNTPVATAGRTIATIIDGTSEQISLRTNASGVPIISRAGTTLATGSTVLSSSTWYFFELKFTIHPSAGVVELRLNNVSEIASTGSLNTRATATTQWNGIGLPFINQTDWNVDDLYVLNTASGANTNFLGPIQVVARYVAGAGTKAEWTANGGTNAGNVSEPYQDGDGSFNQSSTANQIDSFAMQDLPVGSGSVYCVTHLTVARQDSGAARTMASVTRISGSEYVGATKSLSTSYQFLEEIMDLQPVGGTPAWDVATVNAMEAGYKLIS